MRLSSPVYGVAHLRSTRNRDANRSGSGARLEVENASSEPRTRDARPATAQPPPPPVWVPTQLRSTGNYDMVLSGLREVSGLPLRLGREDAAASCHL